MFDLITGDVLHTPRPHAVPVLATVAAHVTLVGAVFAVPMLLLNEELPEVQTIMAFVAAAPAPPPPPPPAPVARDTPAEARLVSNPQAAPLFAPDGVEPETPEQEIGESGASGGVEGGIAGGVVGGVVGGLPAEAPPPPPPPPPPAPRAPVRIGGQVKAPALLHRVEPNYPQIAVDAHLEGLVILEAIVDRDGAVADARVLRSAGALLDREALAALRQWRYSPLLLNGVEERFVLTVTFTFRLDNLRR